MLQSTDKERGAGFDQHKYTNTQSYTIIQLYKYTLDVRENIQGRRCRLDSIAVSVFVHIFGQLYKY